MLYLKSSLSHSCIHGVHRIPNIDGLLGFRQFLVPLPISWNLLLSSFEADLVSVSAELGPTLPHYYLYDSSILRSLPFHDLQIRRII